jgi:hypothetical protein
MADMGKPNIASRVLEELRKENGLTDAEMADRLASLGTRRPVVNAVLRRLERQGRVDRRPGEDGLIRSHRSAGDLTEDEVKETLARRLRSDGWVVEVHPGKEHGVDIEARRAPETWRIEVKGPGTRAAMRVNYFLSALGEILQRMDDPAARYSVAFPDMEQFKSLWDRLPPLARKRTGVTALFVGADGTVRGATS